MSLGFVPYVLLQSKDVFLNATPSRKITPRGFMSMLLANTQPLVDTNLQTPGGQQRPVTIKYRTRVPAGQSSQSDDCLINAIPVYNEATVPSMLFRKYSIHIDDNTIAHYEKEAADSVAVGKPATNVVNEIWDAIIEAANGLFADINGDLVTAQASNFGVNVNNIVSGSPSSAAYGMVFPLATTSNYLNKGMTQVIADMADNEVSIDNCVVVGNGLVHNYYLQQPAKSAGSDGLDTSRLALPQFFYDPSTITGWGSNHFGVFEKNSVQLININNFAGFPSGDKLTTILGTITLPVVDALGGGQLQSFKFDFQVKYIDCPQSITLEGASSSTNVGRGWVFTLMSTYNLFNVPANAYASTDRLYNVNGGFHYSATQS